MSFSVRNEGLRRKEAQITQVLETKLLREQMKTHALRKSRYRRLGKSCHIIMQKDNTLSDHGRTNVPTMWKVYAAGQGI